MRSGSRERMDASDGVRATQLSEYHFIFVDVAAGKLERRLCQNFYEAACQVTRPVREIDIAFRHTPS
jgi:hypothetical protein